MDTMGNGHPHYYRRAPPMNYYPYMMMPMYNQQIPVNGYYQPHASTYTPQFTDKRVAESWRPKRPSKSPKAAHRIATPPYTPPGAKAGTNSDKRFELLRKQSNALLYDLEQIDKRIREMEVVVRRHLYKIGLRQYTRDY